MPRLNISSSTLTSQNQGGGSSKAGSPSTIGLGRFSKNSIKKRASACKCCTTIGTFLFINGTNFKQGPTLVLAFDPNTLNPMILPDSVKVGCTLIHNNIEYTIMEVGVGLGLSAYFLDKDFPLVGINTVVKCC